MQELSRHVLHQNFFEGGSTVSKSFNQLAQEVTAEYLAHGYSYDEASYIGQATAAKAAREKAAFKKNLRKMKGQK